MLISSALRQLRSRARRSNTSENGHHHGLVEVFLRTWDLGFTAFGGPPVHFQILHKKFVENHKWFDEQTYQELFSICQSLPGPGSTKMGFCIVLTHAGLIPALLFFTLWSLPGAIGMFFLAHGVAKVSENSLPEAVYALLSGSNAATVGIIGVAAIQLSQNAITDDLTRLIVIVSACAGLVYNALWYFPTLLVIGGTVNLIWNMGLRRRVFRIRARLARALREPREEEGAQAQGPDLQVVALQDIPIPTNEPDDDPRPDEPRRSYPITLRTGLFLIVAFFASFIAIVVARGTLNNPLVNFKLFSNMYLAGTIIFGGGPVVIPLLREYIVTEGWVSSRDFLIGLAVIQAFPGPNFNFAVYLAALTSQSANSPPIVTALLGFIGIFFPGLTLAVGFSPVWHRLRRYGAVTSALRGINAAAVGLVWTAVYRLWEIGYLKADATSGVSLGLDPWWVVVAVTSFSTNRWFNWPAPASILTGAALGMAWWGAVGRR